MKKIIVLTLLIHIPLFGMKRSIHRSEDISPKRCKVFSAELQARELAIKERIFISFMERYHHNAYVGLIQIPILDYKKLKEDFFNDRVNPNHPNSKLLIDDYNEIMKEWFSNFDE